MDREIRPYFAVIEDTRCSCDIKIPLTDVLIVVMCGVLCGLDTPKRIWQYAKTKEQMLDEKFHISRIPSLSTIYAVLNMVDGDIVGQIIVRIMRDKLGFSGDIIAIDGKTICSTTTSSLVRKLHILTAMLTANGVTLAQLSTDEKSNEIPKMLELLEIIDVEGKVVTSDAMGCQKKTVAKIIAKKGDYCIGLKGNQKQIHTDVKLYFETFRADKTLFEISETSEKSRNRFEIRRCYLFRDIEWLEEKSKWAGLKTVFAIERITATKAKKSTEILFYISSLEYPPEKFLRIVREHWQIEVLHWLLDVDFGEDKNRLRNENGLKSLNALCKFAIALHKNQKLKLSSKESLKGLMFSCLLNDSALFELLRL